MCVCCCFSLLVLIVVKIRNAIKYGPRTGATTQQQQIDRQQYDPMAMMEGGDMYAMQPDANMMMQMDTMQGMQGMQGMAGDMGMDMAAMEAQMQQQQQAVW